MRRSILDQAIQESYENQNRPQTSVKPHMFDTMSDEAIKDYLSKKHYLHNENGPAKVKKDGTIEYWQHNQLHNENGPAIIHPNNEIVWYFNGYLHRIDAPPEYWIRGKQLTEEEFNNRTKPLV